MIWVAIAVVIAAFIVADALFNIAVAIVNLKNNE